MNTDTKGVSVLMIPKQIEPVHVSWRLQELSSGLALQARGYGTTTWYSVVMIESRGLRGCNNIKVPSLGRNYKVVEN